MASDWDFGAHAHRRGVPPDRQDFLLAEQHHVPVYRPGASAPYDQPQQSSQPSNTSLAGLESAGPSRSLAARFPTSSAVTRAPEEPETLAELADDADLLTSSSAESERIAREIAELRLLLAQTTHEAEQLNHRKIIAAAAVREMEERIEQFGRRELRTRYVASVEAEMRSFMMNEQRDQLRAKLTTYERYAHFLRRVHSAAQTLHALPAPPPTAPLVAPVAVPAHHPQPHQSQASPAVASDEFTFTAPSHAVPWMPGAPDRARATAELAGLPVLSGPTELSTSVSGATAGESDIARQRPTTAEIVQLYRLIQAQEDVRQRIAQQLHDGPAQMLSNVVLATEVSEKLFTADPPRALLELQEVRRQVTATLQATRKLIFELRPMAIDDLGLVATIRRYAADLGAQYRTQVYVNAPEGEQAIAAELAVPVFRIAQEALKNAVLHGHASFIRAIVSFTDGRLVLTVYDNGAGFDVQRTLATLPAARAGGLLNMRERAVMLGGHLHIESVPGHGTQIKLLIPMQTQRL